MISFGGVMQQGESRASRAKLIPQIIRTFYEKLTLSHSCDTFMLCICVYVYMCMYVCIYIYI